MSGCASMPAAPLAVLPVRSAPHMPPSAAVFCVVGFSPWRELACWRIRPSPMPLPPSCCCSLMSEGKLIVGDKSWSFRCDGVKKKEIGVCVCVCVCVCGGGG